MIILNATKNQINVMTDRGDLISVAPGEMSKMIIATRNLIIGTMRLGTPKDVGIILAGSYEFEIAKNITGSVPYLYTDIDEARAKLIDPSIDYKSNINAGKLNTANEEALKAKEAEVESLQGTIADLKDQLSKSADRNNEANIDLERRLKEVEGQSIKAQEERDRYKSQLTEAQDQISNLTENLNSLRKENENNKSYYSEGQKVIDKLTGEINELKSENEQLKNQLEQAAVKPAVVTDFEEYNQLKQDYESIKISLEEASNAIDSMKSSFNEACKMFRITKDEEGNWIQLPED